MTKIDSNESSNPRRQGRHLNAKDPTEEEIMAQLERILASSEFLHSPRLQNLLRYVVVETLAGRSDRLKEYTIALDVFGRDKSFDPQISSIVRVEFSRLRGKLERYYAIVGRDDPIWTSLPAGTYTPSFEFAEVTEASGEAVTRSFSRYLPFRLELGNARFIILPLVIAVALASLFVVRSYSPNMPIVSAEPAVEPNEIASVAILPFRNFSGDPDEDYFSDGLTDALITELAQERIAHVTSMTSVLGYKNSDQSLKEIAMELGVSHLVEGSVMRVGGNVRISVQLIEAETDRHLWAENYQRGLTDILGLQNEVVERIVSSVVERVGLDASMQSAQIAEINPMAYEAFLKGRFFLNRMTEEGLRNGINYFQLAIEQDPNYAPSYSGMAACYCLLGGHGFEIVKPSDGMTAAKKAVLESLRLNENLAEPHAFLGIIRLKYDWDWRSAEESFERAIKINPSYSQAHIFYSYYHEAMGNHLEAVREAEAARALDPFSRSANVNLGWQYLQADMLVEAHQTFEQTTELFPNHWGGHWGIGQYHLRMNQENEAVSAFHRAIAAGGGHAMPISALGFAYAISGQKNEAREVLVELEALSEEGYVSPYHMATIYAGLGESDQAFIWLDQAYELRSRSMAWLRVAPEMDSLRSDPRFDELLSRIGLVLSD